MLHAVAHWPHQSWWGLNSHACALMPTCCSTESTLKRQRHILSSWLDESSVPRAAAAAAVCRPLCRPGAGSAVKPPTSSGRVRP